MTTKESYTELKVRIDQMKKSLQEAANTMFFEESKSIFDKFSTLQSFSWRQYTPYFNDGDETIFSANTDDILINMDGVDEAKPDGGFYDNTISVWSHKELTDAAQENEKAAHDVSALLNAIDDDLLKTLFGDHIQITVHRNGTIEKEEFDHD